MTDPMFESLRRVTQELALLRAMAHRLRQVSLKAALDRRGGAACLELVPPLPPRRAGRRSAVR